MLLLKKLDVYSVIHFLWPYAQVLTLAEFGVGYTKACWITLVTVIVWEALDELKKLYKWKKVWWLDPAGFCLTDLLVGLIGIMTAYILKLFF